MIDSPRTVVELGWADHWSHSGPDSPRALAFAQRALAALRTEQSESAPSALLVTVQRAIPQHRGLGGGTQLALATAAGVRTLLGLPARSAAELAAAVGRGERSGVGSHGFIHGGLLWEIGHHPEETIGRLKTRLAVPEAWRIVLIAPRGEVGLSGRDERRAFDDLPSPPDAVTARLIEIAEQQILPGLTSDAIDEFGEGVFEYGRLSGECFAPVQGGAYASREIAACVDAIRALGVHGVGQSSWGPTVYAIVEDEARARWLAKELADRSDWAHHDIQIVAADNVGAVFDAR